MNAKTDMQTFIRVWEKHAASDNPSIEAIADELGLSPHTCQQKATKLRNLPDMPVPLTDLRSRGNRSSSFNPQDALATLAEIRGVTVEELQAESASRAKANRERRAAAAANSSESE